MTGSAITGSTWDITVTRSTACEARRSCGLCADEQFWFTLAAFLPGARLLAGGSQRADRPARPLVLIAMGVLVWTGELFQLDIQAQPALDSVGVNFFNTI